MERFFLADSPIEVSSCNKCNKDFKSQAHTKEKNTGKLHRIKDIKLCPYQYDKFDYPWELAIKIYNPKDKMCKIYTYWYDIDIYKNRYAWFVKLRYVNKELIKLIQRVE